MSNYLFKFNGRGYLLTVSFLQQHEIQDKHKERHHICFDDGVLQCVWSFDSSVVKERRHMCGCVPSTIQIYINHVTLRTFCQVHTVSAKDPNMLWEYFFFKVMDVRTVWEKTQQHRYFFKTHCHAVKVSIWTVSFKLTKTSAQAQLGVAALKITPKWDNHSLFQAQLLRIFYSKPLE